MLDADGREIVPGLKVWVDSPDCGSVANGQADPGVVIEQDHDDIWRVRLDKGIVLRAAHEMGAPKDKLKIGARVSIFGDNDPQGKGEVIGGPDPVGNWMVRWDIPWDGENEGWEALSEDCVEAEPPTTFQQETRYPSGEVPRTASDRGGQK